MGFDFTNTDGHISFGPRHEAEHQMLGITLEAGVGNAAADDDRSIDRQRLNESAMEATNAQIPTPPDQ
ncbi:MAG TPA: hypothetical protein VN808_18070, partial [Stellaceae bacterium]|nr:hypothetical protein [Stellaceae bacterium]